MYIFRDDFLDKPAGWEFVGRNIKSVCINEGKTLLTNHSKDSSALMYIDIGQHLPDSFVFEILLKCIRISDGALIGFLWGDVVNNDICLYLIGVHGHKHGFTRINMGKWDPHTPWNDTTYSINTTRINSYCLGVNPKILASQINGVHFLSIPNCSQKSGSNIGILIGPRIEIEITDVRLLIDEFSSSEESVKISDQWQDLPRLYQPDDIPDYQLYDADLEITEEIESQDSSIFSHPIRSRIFNPDADNDPTLYILSDGNATTDYIEWEEDYRTGGYYLDEDYWIYGRDDI